jgi:hypothetical protein
MLFDDVLDKLHEDFDTSSMKRKQKWEQQWLRSSFDEKKSLLENPDEPFCDKWRFFIMYAVDSLREKPDETERLFMDIDLSSLMELLERKCGREYREVVEEILGNDEAYDNVVPNDHSFLLLKDFCQDVSSGEEEFDIPSHLLEREKKQEMSHKIIKMILFGFGDSSHPSDYTAFVLSDYIKLWTKNWLSQKSKWTEEDFSILFPDLHVIYSTWKDSHKKARAAKDVVEKENKKPTEDEEDEENPAEEEEEEENPQSESEKETILLLRHINHQIPITLNNSHIGDIGWSKRIIDWELWTEDDKMDAHMYNRFTNCRRAMFSKNRKKMAQYLGLDLIKEKKALPPRCFEFLRFVMYDRIGCLVQICRLIRQQQSPSLIKSSILEEYITYQEIVEASELLDSHLPPFNVEIEIKKRIQKKEKIQSGELEKSKKLVFNSPPSIKSLHVARDEIKENSPLPELPSPDRPKPLEPKIDESLSAPKLLPSGEVIFPSKNKSQETNDSDEEKENQEGLVEESENEYDEEDGIKRLLDALMGKSHVNQDQYSDGTYLGRFFEESEENDDIFYHVLTREKSSNKWGKVPRTHKKRKMKRKTCIDPKDLIFDDPSASSSESESSENEKNVKKRKKRKLATTRKRKKCSKPPPNSSRKRKKKTSTKKLKSISTNSRNPKRKISQKQKNRKRRKLEKKSTKSKTIVKKKKNVKKKTATKRKTSPKKAATKQKNYAKKAKKETIKQRKNAKKATKKRKG